MAKYEFEYRYTRQFGEPFHQWSIVGALAGLHVWIKDRGEEFEEQFGSRYSGGIEVHYRTPPSYMSDDAPTYKSCWLLGCPCWHDGSSLQTTEYWIPAWLADPHNHDRMFDLLQADFESRFHGSVAEVHGGEDIGSRVEDTGPRDED